MLLQGQTLYTTKKVRRSFPPAGNERPRSSKQLVSSSFQVDSESTRLSSRIHDAHTRIDDSDFCLFFARREARLV